MMNSLLVIVLLLIFASPLFAQRERGTVPDYQTLLNAAPATSRIIPSSGVFRVLWLFTEFPEDTVLANDGRWPVGKGPSYLNTVIDSTVEQHSGVKNNITSYFRDMSNGRLEVIGTTRYIRAPKPLANYASSTKLDGTPEPENQSGDIHKFVLRDILNQLDKSTDFARFDNYNSAGEPQPDGIVDLVMICYRNPYTPSLIDELYWRGGPRTLEDSIALDQGSLHVSRTHLVFNIGQLVHEYFIFLYELGLQLLPITTVVQNSPGVWSIIRGSQVSSSMMNATERSQLGWCKMIAVNSDTTIALTDYLRTGIAASVRIPLSKRDTGTYYLEYHRKERSPYLNKATNGNDATFDMADITEDVRPGLYILKVVERRGFLEIVTADGAWDWTTSEGVSALWSDWQRLPIFERVAVNRNNGLTDRMLIPFFDPQTNRQISQPIYAWRDRISRELSNTRTGLYAGDGGDAWRSDENNIFSPWSNPSTSWNWFSNTPDKDLAIQVLEERGDTLMVRITYHDPLTLPPSRPQDLHFANDLSDQRVRKLRWELNVEPDVIDTVSIDNSPGTFELWRRVETVVGNVVEEWHPIATMGAGVQAYDDGDYATTYSCIGTDCPEPPTISYRLRVRDSDGLWSTFSAPVEVHSKRAHLQVARTDTRNFVLPNPVLAEAQLFYTVATAGEVRISIVDITGERKAVVVDGHREPGVYVTDLPIESLATGRFFVFVEMPDMREAIPVLYDP
jgi:hypothetical protein